MNSSHWQRSLIVLAFLLTALSFQALRLPFYKSFLGFEIFSLSSSHGCSALQDSELFPRMHRIEVNSGSAKAPTTCESSVIQVRGNYASLELAVKDTATAPHQLTIAAINQLGETVKVISAHDLSLAHKWQRVQFEFDPERTKVIHFVASNSSHDWLTVRTRVNFYQAKLLTKRLSEFVERPGVAYSVSIALACLLLLFIFIVKPAIEDSLPLQFLSFFAIATAVHFRFGLFFNIDDWDILWAVTTGEGASRYFTHHLEHIIPLFKLFLHLEYSLFTGRYELYVLLSILIHTINTLLLRQLLGCLLKAIHIESDTSATTIAILTTLYLVCGLHTEVITWMICQSSLLAATAILTAAISSINYFETKRAHYLLAASFSSLAAPLLFGGGFLVAPFVAGIIGPVVILYDKGKDKLRGYIALCAAITAPLLIVFAIYSNFAAQHSLTANQPPSDYWWQLTRFVLIGALIGVFARVSSIIPYFAVQDWHRDWQNYVTEFSNMFLIGMITGGFFASILIIAAWRSTQNKRAATYLSLSSFLFIVATYLIIGFGRIIDYGALHALAFRYTTIPLLAVFCAALPLTAGIVKYVRNSSIATQNGKLLIALLILLFLFRGQLSLSLSYRHYQISGIQTRSYLEEMKDWETQLAERLGERCTIKIAGEGTELEGNFPLLYGGNATKLYALYPTFDPYRMLSLINGKYPCG